MRRFWASGRAARMCRRSRGRSMTSGTPPGGAAVATIAAVTGERWRTAAAFGTWLVVGLPDDRGHCNRTVHRTARRPPGRRRSSSSARRWRRACLGWCRGRWLVVTPARCPIRRRPDDGLQSAATARWPPRSSSSRRKWRASSRCPWRGCGLRSRPWRSRRSGRGPTGLDAVAIGGAFAGFQAFAASTIALAKQRARRARGTWRAPTRSCSPRDRCSRRTAACPSGCASRATCTTRSAITSRRSACSSTSHRAWRRDRRRSTSRKRTPSRSCSSATCATSSARCATAADLNLAAAVRALTGAARAAADSPRHARVGGRRRRRAGARAAALRAGDHHQRRAPRRGARTCGSASSGAPTASRCTRATTGAARRR